MTGTRIRLGTLVTAIGLAVTVRAQEPDWTSMNYTTHLAFQAVDAAGAGTFQTIAPVKLKGVILNRPADLLDPADAATPYMGGQWQVYVQAVEPQDIGGTALYMGQNIGKNVGNHPAGSYTAVEWPTELARLDRDPAGGRPFRPGDLVEIRARAPGLFFRGKTNINEQHQKDPAADFDVVLLTPNYMQPLVQTITLEDLKDASDQFIFDPARATGPEHYQGTVVRIEAMQFTTGTWGPNQPMTISDGAGRTLPVLLGLGHGFARHPQPTGPVDVVGILDQEDTVATDGMKGGYRLWILDYNGSEFVLYRYVKPDFDRNGDVDAADFAQFEACVSGPAMPPSDTACLSGDFDTDGDVDQADFGILQRCMSLPTQLPDRDCDQ